MEGNYIFVERPTNYAIMAHKPDRTMAGGERALEGSDDRGHGLARSGLATAQADENAPVKIGVLGDQSSVYSAAGGRGSVEAARLAAEDAGLVLGKPVEIVSADFQLKVDIGVAIARKWYDEENVDAIIDVPFSGLFGHSRDDKDEKETGTF